MTCNSGSSRSCLAARAGRHVAPHRRAVPASSMCSTRQRNDVAAREPQPAAGGDPCRRSAGRGRASAGTSSCRADGGATWNQSPVPVSSDLVAVFFVDANTAGPSGTTVSSCHGRRRRHLAAAARRPQGERALVSAMERKAAAEPASEDAKRAGRGEALPGTGPRQAVPRRLVRRREQRLHRRRLQPDLSHDRRRQDLAAVVRSHRQSEVLQPVRDPPGGRRPVHRRRRRARAEARPDDAALQGAAVPYNGSFFGVVGGAGRGAGLRPARQRVPQRRRRRAWTKVDAGLPATIVAGDTERPGRHAARRRRRPRRGDRRRRADFRPVPLKQPMPLTGSPTRARAARTGRPARRRDGRNRGALKRRTHTKGRIKPWQPSANDLDRCRSSASSRTSTRIGQPARAAGVQQPAGDARRLRGRHRRARLCRGDEARAQRELREDDSAQPPVHQELPRPTRRTCAVSATRCASWSRTPTATSSTRSTSKC